ncbi:hypothetical protein DB42_AQ00060 [Neochlamydia sp. EPS4]|uniref:hypothetical protein n=1 Tax=Neochlamydia sp. EPS4 TaxID=1478175 RepID=UPI000582F75A|nr:hypothetical protein [Neochlamydia sp. EPS4]KIC75026.1 hypothetical protein DB42_AQ00060 [Neochlamydia sp. EPS4]
MQAFAIIPSLFYLPSSQHAGREKLAKAEKLLAQGQLEKAQTFLKEILDDTHHNPETIIKAKLNSQIILAYNNEAKFNEGLFLELFDTLRHSSWLEEEEKHKTLLSIELIGLYNPSLANASSIENIIDNYPESHPLAILGRFCLAERLRIQSTNDDEQKILSLYKSVHTQQVSSIFTYIRGIAALQAAEIISSSTYSGEQSWLDADELYSAALADFSPQALTDFDEKKWDLFFEFSRLILEKIYPCPSLTHLAYVGKAYMYGMGSKDLKPSVEKAIFYYEKSLETNIALEGQIEPKFCLAELYFSHGEASKALSFFDEVIDSSTHDSHIAYSFMSKCSKADILRQDFPDITKNLALSQSLYQEVLESSYKNDLLLAKAGLGLAIIFRDGDDRNILNWPDAIFLFKQIIEAKDYLKEAPQLVSQAQLNYAEMLYKGGNEIEQCLPEAMQLFTCLLLDEKQEEAIIAKGLNSLTQLIEKEPQAGQIQKVLDLFEQVIQQKHLSKALVAQTYYCKAKIYRLQNRLEDELYHLFGAHIFGDFIMQQTISEEIQRSPCTAISKIVAYHSILKNVEASLAPAPDFWIPPLGPLSQFLESFLIAKDLNTYAIKKSILIGLIKHEYQINSYIDPLLPEPIKNELYDVLGNFCLSAADEHPHLAIKLLRNVSEKASCYPASLGKLINLVYASKLESLRSEWKAYEAITSYLEKAKKANRLSPTPLLDLQHTEKWELAARKEKLKFIQQHPIDRLISCPINRFSI